MSGGSRLRVALAFPPAETLSPYGADATILSRLGVTEGLTSLDGNGAAAPALAASWRREGERSWVFRLREAHRPTPAALAGVGLTAKAAGKSDVRITTDDPDPVLPLRLSSPSLAVGSTAVTLDRYDDYWGGRAQAPGIDVKFIPDGTARTSALRTRQVDLAEAVPVAQAASLDKGVRKATETTRTTSLLLNSESGPFKDAGLRAAVRQAVDTSVLAEDVYEGYADAGTGIYGPAVTWADDPDGTRITLATYDNRPELPEVAQVLEQQLAQAGFDVTLQVREYSRLERDALDGEFDAFVLPRNTLVDTGDPVSVLASDYTCDGGYNLAQLCDRDVDRAVARAEDADDTAARQHAAMAAEARILGTGTRR